MLAIALNGIYTPIRPADPGRSSILPADGRALKLQAGRDRHRHRPTPPAKRAADGLLGAPCPVHYIQVRGGVDRKASHPWESPPGDPGDQPPGGSPAGNLFRVWRNTPFDST